MQQDQTKVTPPKPVKANLALNVGCGRAIPLVGPTATGTKPSAKWINNVKEAVNVVEEKFERKNTTTTKTEVAQSLSYVDLSLRFSKKFPQLGEVVGTELRDLERIMDEGMPRKLMFSRTTPSTPLKK